MSFLQRGLPNQASLLVLRPRPQSFTLRVRSPLRRVQQPRRYNSTNKNEPPKAKEGHLGDASSFHTSAAPQPNASAAAAGAAATPHTATAVTRTRAFQEMIKAGPLGKFGRWYARMQNDHTYKTQFFSSIIIYLCGDLGAQLLFPPEEEVQAAKAKAAAGEEDDEKVPFGTGYNPWRTVRHLIIGAGSSIPTYKWFMFLHNHFNYSSKLLSVLTKVTVQQICFTPVFNTYFFSMHSLLAGATFEETLERLKKALPVSISNSVKLWPAVTAFSFMYVPPEFRNVFQGGIAVCWQTYLSWLNQKAAREVREAEAALEASSHAIAGNLLPAAGTA